MGRALIVNDSPDLNELAFFLEYTRGHQPNLALVVETEDHKEAAERIFFPRAMDRFGITGEGAFTFEEMLEYLVGEFFDWYVLDGLRQRCVDVAEVVGPEKVVVVTSQLGYVHECRLRGIEAVHIDKY